MRISLASASGSGAKPFPYKGLRFIAYIEGVPVLGFSRISGLNMENKYIDHNIGGDPIPVKLFDGISLDQIILERGLTKQPYLWQWFTSRYWGALPRSVLGMGDIRRNVTITLLSRRGDIARTWIIYDAVPSRIETGELDASTGAVVVERVSLLHRGFDLVNI